MAARLKRQVAKTFVSHPPDKLGVAVSGGGDSMALLYLLRDLCNQHGSRLHVVSVNHGLRPEAGGEVDFVAQHCAEMGLRHDTLLWQGWDGQGNLQNAARQGRYGLMADWARAHGINAVALGHTADDQAETVLMRLARQAGVDGLSGMARRSFREGVTWVRPLLGATRAELRGYLAVKGRTWVEDPSNDDTAFARIQTRKVLELLTPLGIDAQGLSEVAENMAQARTALGWQSFLAARDICHIDAGAVVMNERGLRVLPDEIQRRLFIRALTWISGSQYPPRRAAVAELMQALQRGQAFTVDGAHARRVNGQIWVFRELNAVRDISCGLDQRWDDRWLVTPPPVRDDGHKAVTLRALGTEGLAQCPDWRATGRPHTVLLSTPAVWQGDIVLAAPLAGLDQKWHVQVDGGDETFFAALLSH